MPKSGYYEQVITPHAHYNVQDSFLLQHIVQSLPYAIGKSMRGVCACADAPQVRGIELDTDRENHSNCRTPVPECPYWKLDRVHCQYQGEFHKSLGQDFVE